MSTCRNRKVECPHCGNLAYQSRGRMLTGLLGCPCGGTLEPAEPCDKAFCGLIGPDDMSQAQWNAICRENGWPIVWNHGQAVAAAHRGLVAESVFRSSPAKPQCSHPGCGRWTAGGAEHCNLHSSALVADPIPF